MKIPQYVLAGTTAGVLLMGAALSPATAEAAAKGTFGVKAGYEGLYLGQSLKKVRKAGKIHGPTSGTCSFVTFRSRKKHSHNQNVVISNKYGVVLISAGKSARTARGIGIGSTLKQVKKAYPRFHLGAHAWEIPLPKYPKYVFGLDIEKNRVAELWLEKRPQDCFN
jgi:hypothetical protein